MREESKEPGEIRFHYNREERVASLPENLRERSGRRGILRGNRSLVITLIDVGFLLALVLVISVVSRLMGDNTVLPGYTVSATATAFGDRVLVSVKVTAREESATAEAVRIQIGYPDGSYRVELDDFLPESAKTESVYRGSIVHQSGMKQVKIDLYTGDSSGSLTTRIRAE